MIFAVFPSSTIDSSKINSRVGGQGLETLVIPCVHKVHTTGLEFSTL